ncbi:hypothetical protein BK133_18810 [Paenibacillus sp. FSL H8-0548]|uniref:hypothetical protein n=1 Tax=Paenibacillus sp. FSL H8-0548 TaxID=1920422 RepID=UPI00096D9DEF|nr:hypothetical protein [Paenibacillus sp. FSL H8-0548]OMF28070.1 hypothetical protein BK133_18810 [Paenibacillus sp. FSL H8-0548]
MKRSYMMVIGFLVLAAAVLLFLFRVSEGQVTVQRMIDFEQVEPTSQVVWKDRSSVSAFEYAFRFGKKLEGKVDIAHPPEELPSPFIESPTPIPVPSSSLPSAEAYTPAYLDSASFSSEEQPLIALINLRIKAVHEGDWEQFVSLYTEFKRKEYEASGSFNGMTTTSIKVDGDISIKEQKSLFEAVVWVKESRNNGEGSAGMYVFHKGKQQGDEWRIADVD